VKVGKTMKEKKRVEAKKKGGRRLLWGEKKRLGGGR
jgi:hypothetical protein